MLKEIDKQLSVAKLVPIQILSFENLHIRHRLK